MIIFEFFVMFIYYINFYVVAMFSKTKAKCAAMTLETRYDWCNVDGQENCIVCFCSASLGESPSEDLSQALTVFKNQKLLQFQIN